jgi:hypothetical protein
MHVKVLMRQRHRGTSSDCSAHLDLNLDLDLDLDLDVSKSPSDRLNPLHLTAIPACPLDCALIAWPTVASAD